MIQTVKFSSFVEIFSLDIRIKFNSLPFYIPPGERMLYDMVESLPGQIEKDTRLEKWQQHNMCKKIWTHNWKVSSRYLQKKSYYMKINRINCNFISERTLTLWSFCSPSICFWFHFIHIFIEFDGNGSDSGCISIGRWYKSHSSNQIILVFICVLCHVYSLARYFNKYDRS